MRRYRRATKEYRHISYLQEKKHAVIIQKTQMGALLRMIQNSKHFHDEKTFEDTAIRSEVVKVG